MCSQWTSKQRIRLNLPISALYLHFSVLSPFQRFIPISAFYPHFSVLPPFQRFIPISAFYPRFSVLSPFQRFIPISAFYPHFSVLSPISAFYPHFSFRFQFSFPRFSFSVLSLPACKYIYKIGFYSTYLETCNSLTALRKRTQTLKGVREASIKKNRTPHFL